MPDLPPARLEILFARDVPRAVILRTGPSRHTRMILWDTRRDAFTDGQWVKHRIYAQRCHLSPDGKHFVYCGFRPFRPDGRSLGGYTAISRPPFFTALWFHAQHDTWGGGGTFVDNRNVWLHLPYPGEALSAPPPPGLIPVFHPATHPAHGRKGRSWGMVPEFLVTGDGKRAALRRADLDRLRAEQEAPGFDKAFIGHGQPDWPDWCVVRDGCLYRRQADGTETLLRDFNAMRFEPVEAPYRGVPVLTRPARAKAPLRSRTPAPHAPAFFKPLKDPALPND
ncbi:MAG: hypothetical protein Kow0013_13630 [Pararhodobacter sp.]